MRPLDQETDVNIIRSYARAVEVRLIEAEQIIKSLQKNLAEENQTSLKFSDQLSRLEKNFFGFGRETRKDRPRVVRKNEQLRLHSEHSTFTDIFPSEDEKILIEPTLSNYLMKPEDFRDEVILREIQVKNPIEAWEEMKNFYQESTEITVTERTYQKVIHRQAFQIQEVQ